MMNNTENQYNVDLKWCLWSAKESWWNEYQNYDSDAKLPKDQSLWDAMQSAFDGTTPAITIHTAPNKEIRYGTVVISKGAAYYHFYTEWDEPHEQTPDEIYADDSLRQAFEEWLTDWFMALNGFMDNSPIGASVEGNAAADSFAELMSKIDAQEDALIDQEQSNSTDLDGEVANWMTLNKPINTDCFSVVKRRIGSKNVWDVVKDETLYPFAVDAATRAINHLEGFRTKKQAKEWIESGCPIAGDIDRTHIVWAKNIKDAYKLDEECALYRFSEDMRMELAKAAEKHKIDLFNLSAQYYLRFHI